MVFVGGNNAINVKIVANKIVESPSNNADHPKVKKLCLKMYLNGMGFPAIASSYRN
ncbi:hypothetical protein [Okeania sp. SIO1H2]|uniref:hypothetical protein n=1 Tax=Okeania sp. SIO1H2 TaxID=2607775 RepID=UPI00141CC545|nr:hypothetical protein [Okeania sp. SIO1H2]NET94024.1 hypothetical protein [Okeania sp. SIO1H2]